MEGTDGKNQSEKDNHSARYQQIQQELQTVDVEAVGVDVDTMKNETNEIEQPRPNITFNFDVTMI
jgi:hypothetical protein